MFFSQARLTSATIKLWAKVVGQSHFGADIQAVGTSIRVGIRSFNTVGG